MMILPGPASLEEERLLQTILHFKGQSFKPGLHRDFLRGNFNFHNARPRIFKKVDMSHNLDNLEAKEEQ